MIAHLHMCLNHGRRVQGGRTLTFREGLNVLVGPNGSGKSTVLRSIAHCPDCRREEDGPCRYRLFNSETMNPHTGDPGVRGPIASVYKTRAMFSSHGQILQTVIGHLGCEPGDVLLIDEPEAGQDLENVRRIRRVLDYAAEIGAQVIAASHHPVMWAEAHILEPARPGYAAKALRAYQNIQPPNEPL